MRLLSGLLAVLLAFGLMGCSNQVSAQISSSNAGNISTDAPLIASVDSQEAAEALAEQYGITLVSYEYGIATFFTEEDPQAVIARGIQNGWTELSLNHITVMP